MNRLIASLVVISAVFLFSAQATAQAKTYLLDQSNHESVFPDSNPYLRVDISDAGDAIRFDVTLLDPLLNAAGYNFGLQSFGFNLADGATEIDPYANIEGLPTGWAANDNRRQDGFGRFEIVSNGNGRNRVSPTLTFFIVGIDGDSVDDYVAMSSGNAGQGNQLFAARVAGFDPYVGVSSAFFGGSTVVPLPLSLTLLLPGFALFMGWARRCQSSHFPTAVR